MVFRLEHIVSSLHALPILHAPARPLPDSEFEVDRSRYRASPGDEDLLVSIIIPCYNGEAYLQEAIESALAQTYRPVEVIVVDDGSTDRSSEIAQKLPVRYIRQPNRGLTKSRNLGVRKSRGSYVVFLDADDRLKPDAVKTGLRVLAGHPECAMAVGDHIFVSREGRQIAGSRKECLPASHYEALLKSNFIEMISTVLFRRSVLEDVGGFDTKLRVAEDYELYLRIARDYPICCHSTVVAEYRMHQANVSHNSALMLATTLQVLKSQQRFVRGNARRLFAFLAGIRTWRKQYGRQLASELARSYRTLQVDDLRRKLLLLVMHYPQGLLVFLLLRLAPTLDKRYAGSHGGYTLSQRLQAWTNAPKAQSSN
jgi:glycosyltransferase involved in cell wall biosynthesis